MWVLDLAVPSPPRCSLWRIPWPTFALSLCCLVHHRNLYWLLYCFGTSVATAETCGWCTSRQMGRQCKCKYTFYTNSVYRWKIPLNMLQRVGLPEWGLWIPAIKLVTGNWCYLCDCISSLMENMVLLCIFSFGEYLTVPSYAWLGISPRVLLPGEVCLG